MSNDISNARNRRETKWGMEKGWTETNGGLGAWGWFVLGWIVAVGALVGMLCVFWVMSDDRSDYKRGSGDVVEIW